MERPRGEEQVGVDVAQHRNNHDRSDGGIAKSPKDAIGDCAQNKIITGDFIHWEAVQRYQIQQEVNPHHGEDAAENGARNVPAGIAHFFAEINNSIPSVNCKNDGLQSKNEGDGERPPSGEGWQSCSCRRSSAALVQSKNKASDDNKHYGPTL